MPYTWLYYIMSNLLPNKNCQIMLIYQMAKIDRYPLLKSSSSTEQNNKKLTHLEPSFHNLFVLNTVYTDIYLKQTRSWATGARLQCICDYAVGFSSDSWVKIACEVYFTYTCISLIVSSMWILLCTTIASVKEIYSSRLDLIK